MDRDEMKFHFSVENHLCGSLEEFLYWLSARKVTLVATDSWHRYSFYTNLPFVKTGVTALIEENDGVRTVVAVPMFCVFSEEERCAGWEHSRWLFTTWRKLQQSGELTKALEWFYNTVGDFDKIAQFQHQARADIEAWHGTAMEYINSITLAQGDEFTSTKISLDQAYHSVLTMTKKLLWGRLFWTLGEYMKYRDEHGPGQNVEIQDE